MTLYDIYIELMNQNLLPEERLAGIFERILERIRQENEDKES